MPFSGFRRSLAQVERAVLEAEQQQLGLTYIVRLIEQFDDNCKYSQQYCRLFGLSPGNVWGDRTSSEDSRVQCLLNMAREKRTARPAPDPAKAEMKKAVKPRRKTGVTKKQANKVEQQVRVFLHIFHLISFFCAARPNGRMQTLVTFLQQQYIRQHVCIISPLKSPRTSAIYCLCVHPRQCNVEQTVG